MQSNKTVCSSDGEIFTILETASKKVQFFLERYTGFNFKFDNNMLDSLRNGVIFCYLANRIWPNSILQFNKSGNTETNKRNLKIFLKTCQNHMNDDIKLFKVKDFEEPNPNNYDKEAFVSCKLQKLVNVLNGTVRLIQYIKDKQSIIEKLHTVSINPDLSEAADLTIAPLSGTLMDSDALESKHLSYGVEWFKQDIIEIVQTEINDQFRFNPQKVHCKIAGEVRSCSIQNQPMSNFQRKSYDQDNDSKANSEMVEDTTIPVSSLNSTLFGTNNTIDVYNRQNDESIIYSPQNTSMSCYCSLQIGPYNRIAAITTNMNNRINTSMATHFNNSSGHHKYHCHIKPKRSYLNNPSSIQARYHNNRHVLDCAVPPNTFGPNYKPRLMMMRQFRPQYVNQYKKTITTGRPVVKSCHHNSNHDNYPKSGSKSCNVMSTQSSNQQKTLYNQPELVSKENSLTPLSITPSQITKTDIQSSSAIINLPITNDHNDESQGTHLSHSSISNLESHSRSSTSICSSEVLTDRQELDKNPECLVVSLDHKHFSTMCSTNKTLAVTLANSSSREILQSYKFPRFQLNIIVSSPKLTIISKNLIRTDIKIDIRRQQQPMK